MPSFNGSRRRHSKQTASSSSKKKVPPPDLTLTSRYSSSSNNSDAQQTPRSIFSSSLRPSKRAKDAKPVKKEEALNSHPVSPSDRQDRRSVDVFAFMEKDDVSWDSPAITETLPRHDDASDEELSSPVISSRIEAPQASPHYSDLEVKAIQDDSHRRWGRASLHDDGGLHSDSGVSMHSGSPEEDSPILQHKFPMIQQSPVRCLEPSILEDDEPQSAITQRDSPDFHAATYNRPPHRLSSSLETSEGWVPEACQVSPPPLPIHHEEQSYLAPQPQRPINAQSHLEIPLHNASHQQHIPSPSPTSSDTKRTGYDLLASTITSHPQTNSDTVLKPIYRKFETLNNRMLLYLQDEISELEAQLSELDAAIATEENEHGAPQSRRVEAKLPSQLQWHRMDLLGRSFAKVEQYNRALSSYAALVRTLPPASKSDISTYKSWIETHTPLATAETAFLSSPDDLVTVLPTLPAPPSFTASNTNLTTSAQRKFDNPAIVLAFAFVATIIVFKVVPHVFARLVISALVGVASLCLLSEQPLKWENLRAERRKRECGLYAGVMGVLAVVVR